MQINIDGGNQRSREKMLEEIKLSISLYLYVFQ